MVAVLNAAIGYQAIHLPSPQHALRHARQQVTKAWAQQGASPASFTRVAMMAHWRYYGNNTGALVNTAYAKHAAHLLHGMTHNHKPEVRKDGAVRIKEAQTASNACPPWILAQHGVQTSVSTSICAQLQRPLPHHTRAIRTNDHCDQQVRMWPRTPTSTGTRQARWTPRASWRPPSPFYTSLQHRGKSWPHAKPATPLSSPTRNGQHDAYSRRTSAHAPQKRGVQCRDPRTSARTTSPSIPST